MWRPEPRRAGIVLFAEDFDAPEPVAEPEPEIIEPVFTQADLERARSEAWQAGHDAAARDAADSTRSAIRDAMVAIAAGMADARAEAAALADQAAEAIARLLLEALGSVLPALSARHGAAELRSLIRILLPALCQEPAVTIRLHPDHVAAVREEIAGLDPELAERMQIVPSNAAAPGDVRIAWRNGHAERNAGELWSQVMAVLDPAGLMPHAPSREIEHVE